MRSADHSVMLQKKDGEALYGLVHFGTSIVFGYFRANCKELKLRFSVHKNLILLYKIHFDWNLSFFYYRF